MFRLIPVVDSYWGSETPWTLDSPLVFWNSPSSGFWWKTEYFLPLEKQKMLGYLLSQFLWQPGSRQVSQVWQDRYLPTQDLESRVIDTKKQRMRGGESIQWWQLWHSLCLNGYGSKTFHTGLVSFCLLPNTGSPATKILWATQYPLINFFSA